MLDSISTTILRLFREFGQAELDLHTLFEAGGNDPAKREAVLDAVARLVRDELLAERGNDFYALTEKGKSLAAGGWIRR
jgi:hypothetical protein